MFHFIRKSQSCHTNEKYCVSSESITTQNIKTNQRESNENLVKREYSRIFRLMMIWHGVHANTKPFSYLSYAIYIIIIEYYGYTTWWMFVVHYFGLFSEQKALIMKSVQKLWLNSTKFENLCLCFALITSLHLSEEKNQNQNEKIWQKNIRKSHPLFTVESLRFGWLSYLSFCNKQQTIHNWLT